MMQSAPDCDDLPVVEPSGWQRPDIARGVRKALPMALGYVPLGFTFGVVALGAGMSVTNTVLMSLMVFACSSQILTVQMLATGAPISSMIATVFIVNLRHLLMSSALAPYLKRYRKSEIVAFTFHLSDEAFALHSNDFARRSVSRVETFATNLCLHTALMIGTIAAMLTGASPEDMKRFGLDFAPVAMFIAMLALLIKDKVQMAVAILCGLLAVVLAQTGMGTWYIIATTIVGATAGALGEQWISRRSSSPQLA